MVCMPEIFLDNQLFVKLRLESEKIRKMTRSGCLFVNVFGREATGKRNSI